MAYSARKAATVPVQSVPAIEQFFVIRERGNVMVNGKMRQLGSCRSAIREIFEYGKQRAAQVGEENVFDFSLGNPSIPAPAVV